MNIGTFTTGKVEELGEESIQTKFVVIGMPLWPLQSYYVTSERESGIAGHAIRLNRKSIIAGYARWYAGVAAFVFGLAGILELVSGRVVVSGWTIRPLVSITVAIVLIIVAVASYRLGALSEAERHRRSVLRRVTGIGAPPSVLPRHLTSEISARLERAWKQAHGNEPWEAAAAEARPDPLLVAILEYSGRESDARRILSALPEASESAK